jgi:CRISPR-associated protein Cmr2
MTILAFSIGPVQSYIAQSRRTADGWIGSFLLSYLGCRAAIALQPTYGQVEEPCLEGLALYREVLRRTPGQAPPCENSASHPDANGKGLGSGTDGGEDLTIAGLPNTLIVRLCEEALPPEAGATARAAVLTAWKEIEQAIWAGAPQPARTPFVETLWRRQVDSLWETYWAWGPTSEMAHRGLAARKGLRDFPQIEERGERCTLCAEREALWDGGHTHEAPLAAVLRFWRQQALIPRGAPAALIKAGDAERLCAPCLIKRLIPHVPDNPISRMWKVREGIFPSTSTIATVHAKAAIVRTAYGRAADDRLRTAVEMYLAVLNRPDVGGAVRAVAADAFPCWEAVLQEVKPEYSIHARRFLGLDGDWLQYGESVRNEYGITDAHTELLRAARGLLRQIQRAIPDGKGTPPIYWALLAMDGDRIGSLKEAFSPRAGAISAQLSRFAREVPGIVAQHDGRLIYAGGDDVLALLPVGTALCAADALRRRFADIFADWLGSIGADREAIPAGPPTLSGALIYAHHQAPLGGLIVRGHRLLTQEAKARVGRNALAVEVRTRSGPSLSFAMKWEDPGGRSLVARIDRVMTLLRQREVASGFLYDLRNRADLLGGRGPFAAHGGHRLDYLASLAEKSRLARKDEASSVAEELLALCGPPPEDGPLAVDALLFARFLAGGGREER